MNFKFSFLLVLWKIIIGKVSILSNYLQNSKIDLITAHDMVSTCFLDISSLRKEEYFLKIKCNATDCVDSYEATISLSKDVKELRRKYMVKII